MHARIYGFQILRPNDKVHRSLSHTAHESYTTFDLDLAFRLPKEPMAYDQMILPHFYGVHLFFGELPDFV